MIHSIDRKNKHELSFTLFETIIAVALLMTFVLEMAAGQGTVVSKLEYSRRSNEAIWLAKRIMSQVEYNVQTYELQELDTGIPERDQKFEGITTENGFDYLYSIEVKEWKFPLFDFLLNGKGAGDENEESNDEEQAKPAGAGIPGIDAILNQIFNGHILKIAHVEVSWPEGARRESVALSYLLTNTKALDEYLTTKKSVFDQIIKKMQPSSAAAPVFPPPGTTRQADGSYLGEDGTIYYPNGSKLLPDGTRVEAPAPAALPRQDQGQSGSGVQPPNTNANGAGMPQ